MTKTPRTDAAAKEGEYGQPMEIVDADFARELEREIADLRHDLERGMANHNADINAESPLPNAIWLAKFCHDTYERLAPQYGYETRQDTRTFDHESPNGRLMAAVFEELRATLLPSHPAAQSDEGSK